MTFDPRYAIVTAFDSGIGKAVALARNYMDWAQPGGRLRNRGIVVDGGMLQMGPKASSHLSSNDWRKA